jgi:hypothetical protein
MPRPRKLTDEMRQRLRAIALARRALPSNKELAIEFDLSERTIDNFMCAFRRTLTENEAEKAH